MKKICEISNIEGFRLSTGEFAFVGNFTPNLDCYLPECKALLLVNGILFQKITVIGEDRLIGSNRAPRKDRRSIRTKDVIEEIPEGSDISLNIYMDD